MKARNREEILRLLRERTQEGFFFASDRCLVIYYFADGHRHEDGFQRATEEPGGNCIYCGQLGWTGIIDPQGLCKKIIAELGKIGARPQWPREYCKIEDWWTECTA